MGKVGLGMIFLFHLYPENNSSGRCVFFHGIVIAYLVVITAAGDLDSGWSCFLVVDLGCLLVLW